MTQNKPNRAILELMRHSGVRYRTAWLIKHKIMQPMTEREAEHPLGGTVLVDNACPGGERNGGKAGRGSERATAVSAKPRSA